MLLGIGRQGRAIIFRDSQESCCPMPFFMEDSLNTILQERRRFKAIYRRIQMFEGEKISGSGAICRNCFLPADFKIPPPIRSGKPLLFCIDCAAMHIHRREQKSKSFRADLLADPGARLRGVVY